MATPTLDAMAPLSFADRPLHLLTAEDAQRMWGEGILPEDAHVELLHGVLTRMSPQKPPHAVAVERLTRWLAPLMATHRVRVQLPFSVPDPFSLPEPHLAVAEASDDLGHPTTALLVIEVAWSSLAADLKVKPPLYAAAGVPEYWVLDPHGRRVVVHERPEAGGYATTRTLTAPAMLQPAALDVAPLDLAALLAGLEATR